MTDLNKVILIGRMTRDIGSSEREFAYTASGTARLNISIAVNESRKQGSQWTDEANFFDITIFGKTAENLRQYLGKGKQIAVSGHLQQQKWNGQDGYPRSKVVVIADTVQLLGGGNTQGSNSANYQQGGGYQQPPQDNSGGDYQDGLFPEDIPF